MVAFSFVLIFSLFLSSNYKHENKVMPTNDKIVDTQQNLRKEVVIDRQRRVQGVWTGGSMVVTGAGLGILTGILDTSEIAPPITVAALGVAAWTKFLEEHRSPLDDSYFTVETSTIPNAGKGLFAAQRIPKGTFLFSYGGERLNEEEYFERYPDGQGRYIAELPSAPWSFGEPIYVDGFDSTISGWARWMNSKRIDDMVGCNVIGKKSISGERNFYFYARRDISPGEELCFDYGKNYWDAVDGA